MSFEDDTDRDVELDGEGEPDSADLKRNGIEQVVPASPKEDSSDPADKFMDSLGSEEISTINGYIETLAAAIDVAIRHRIKKDPSCTDRLTDVLLEFTHEEQKQIIRADVILLYLAASQKIGDVSSQNPDEEVDYERFDGINVAIDLLLSMDKRELDRTCERVRNWLINFTKHGS